MSPASIPMGHHGALKASHTVVPGSGAAFTVKQQCSVYYGQKKASTLPAAFGETLSWAPCGYLPQQLRSAYGATRSGLTGQGVSVAILSEDNDSTALSDTNHWARDRHFPPFKPGQFAANIAAHGVPNGVGDIESALDVESVHGMAPAARVNYVVGNGIPMRVVPDISDLGDWNLGYQIGVSIPVGHHKIRYFNQMNGGTSLSSPMFTGLQAEVTRARR